MDRDHLHPRRLGQLRQLWRVQAGVIPAKPGFQRDRHLDRRYHRLNQTQGMGQILHQRRPTGPGRHPLGRASHVDVDDPRPLPFDKTRGLRHPVRLAPGKLDRGRLLAKTKLCPSPRQRLGLDHFLARHHFRHDQTGTKRRNQAAPWQVGNASHRRQNHGRGQRNRSRGQYDHVHAPCLSRFTGNGKAGPQEIA